MGAAGRSERVAIGEAIEHELGERRGNPEFSSIPENFPGLQKGDTRDIAAKAASFPWTGLMSGSPGTT